jgi:hypothetical protein
MKGKWMRNTAVISVVLLFTASLLSQTGVPVLKIVVDEKGNRRVFDMQGNEVQDNSQQIRNMGEKGLNWNESNDSGRDWIQSMSSQKSIGPPQQVRYPVNRQILYSGRYLIRVLRIRAPFLRCPTGTETGRADFII